MKYEQPTVLDLLKDENFKSWVLHPTPELDFFWRSWVENHPSQVGKIEEARAILLSAKPSKHGLPTLSSQDKEAIFQQVLAKSSLRKGAPKAKSHSFLTTSLKIAAALVVILVATYLLLDKTTSNPPLERVTSTMIEKTTSSGQMSTVTLPDRSVVKLAANSKIKYAQHFSDSNREVWLEGQAFFDVEEDKTRPFFVYTKNFHTRVLGTSFSVRHFPNEPTIEVALVSGEVLVEDSEYSINEYLAPGQKVRIEKSAKSFDTAPLDYDRDLAWKDGILVLRDDDLESLATKLEDWYGVTVELGAIEGEHKFNARFKRKSLRYVMEALTQASDIEYKLKAKKLWIQTSKHQGL